jgi:3-hydroxyisobutyrate dehydrogenase-like beta-hydroxyacid dehydrogenase
MKIGLIGLGRIGQPIAMNLLAAGHRVFVHDIRREACTPLVAAGAHPENTPAEIAANVEVVLTSLPGPREVEAVMTEVFEAVTPGVIVIDTSTVGPALSQRLARHFHQKGVAYLDAPVSGGRERAETGTLTMMVGGEQEAFERVKPVLNCLASRLHYVGPSGTGHAIKLLIQMIYLPYVAAFCEGLSLGEKLGIPFDTLFEILASSSAGQPGIDKRYEALKSNDLTPRFEVDAALKDLALALELSAEHQHPALLAEAAREAYQRASSLGLGDKDLTALRALHQTP